MRIRLDSGACRVRMMAAGSSLVLVLAGCGGGGGGGSNGGEVGGGTGFIPAAPTPGAILYEDAVTLRPLRDGALWVYRGVRSSGGQTINYESYRRTRAAANGFVESQFSSLDGGETNEGTVRVENGTISVREESSGLFGGTVSYVELRSPVRTNDQATLFDRVAFPLNEDLDGDRSNDTADIAAYSRVVGNESVTLPELGRTVTALRVDATVTARLRLSSRSQPEAPVSFVVSTWYAPGMGVVREATTEPAVSGIGAPDTDERLQYWDGVTRGVGMWPSVRLPKSGGSAAIGPWLGFPYSAISVGNRVFVLSSLVGEPVGPERGVAISVVDARGGVSVSVEHPDLALEVNARPQLMPLGAGAAFALTEPGAWSDPYMLENLRLVVFDAFGQRSKTSILVRDALPRKLKAASDGQTIWVAWVERTPPFGPYRVMVQRFGPDALPLSPAEVLDTRTSAIQDGIEITAAAGRALVSWRAPDFFGDEYRQAIVPATGAFTLGMLAAGTRAGSEPARPIPWLSDSMAIIGWYRPLEQVNATVPLQTALRGVVLDSAAMPRRSNSGAIDTEILPLPEHESFAAARAIDQGAFLWARGGSAVLSPTELAPRAYVELQTLSPANGALATATPVVRRYRNSTPLDALGTSAGHVQHVVPLSDRWLVFGFDSVSTVAVIHRD
jgi:hypothetical protein